jgi:hypothetical protein
MSDLDSLMDIDPLELTADPAKLEAYIKAHRERRAKHEGGAGRKAVKDAGPKLALPADFIKNLAGKSKPEVVVKRRI